MQRRRTRSARSSAVALLLLLCATRTQAQVGVDVRDGASAQRCTSSGVACAHNVTIGAASAICFGIVVTETSGGGGTAVTAASYAGSALTDTGVSQVWAATNSNLAKIYCGVSPTTGTNSASVTATGHGGFAVMFGAVSFTGTETSSVANMIGLTGTGTGSGTTATTTGINAASTNWIFGAGGQGSGNTMAPGASFTESFEKVGGGATAGDNLEGVDKQGSGASQIPTFTWSGSDNWGMVSVEIKAASGGGSTSAMPSTLALMGMGMSVCLMVGAGILRPAPLTTLGRIVAADPYGFAQRQAVVSELLIERVTERRS